MIIIGIDPGTQLGYGVVEKQDSLYINSLDYGCLKLGSTKKLSQRYLIIFDLINKLIDKYQPDALAVESQYVHKNIKTAMQLSIIRGIAILASTKSSIPIYEYSPATIKRAIIGNGNASKEQIKKMVSTLLNLSYQLDSSDIADALALAICHIHTSKLCNNNPV